jgi:hypothetical protein
VLGSIALGGIAMLCLGFSSAFGGIFYFSFKVLLL